VTSHPYDCVVVGGGVSGLTTALRLRKKGWRVLLLERELLGSGATLRNQSIIHSGALYSLLHPNIVSLCQEAQAAYASSFPDAILPSRGSWYMASADRLNAFKNLWRRQGIEYLTAGREVVTEILEPDKASHLSAAFVADRHIDSKRLVEILAERCLRAGVDIEVRSEVVEVEIRGTAVTGVALADSRYYRCRALALCSGAGTQKMLASLGSQAAKRVKSRIGTVLAISSHALDVGVMSLEYGGPCIIPGGHDVALITQYGAKQRWIERSHPERNDDASGTALGTLAVSFFRENILNPDSWLTWQCVKTEFSTGRHDAWGVEPVHAVVDHKEFDDVSGLWTLLPGKMTLALHASRDLVIRMTGTNIELDLLDNRRHFSSITSTQGLIADPPHSGLSSGERPTSGSQETR
jgi:glycine/D-amino acid oxidase-like deaminating enzyme